MIATAPVFARARDLDTRGVRAAWPLWFLVITYPALWLLGVGYVAWPVLTFPILLGLLARRNVRTPPAFALWLLFLVLMLLSSIELDNSLRMALFGWRASVYITATAVFLWVYSSSHSELSNRTVTLAMALFWAEAVIGGLLGVFLPNVSFHSPVEHLLPATIRADPTAYAYVHPAFADVKFLALGHAIGRPKTLFAYTNQWGSAVGVLTPFAIAGISLARRRLVRQLLGLLLIVSIVPIVVSVNRGLWLALGAGLVYLAARSALTGRARPLLVGGGMALLLAGVVAASPLGTIVHERISSQKNSNNTRATLYREAVHQVLASPVFGYGSPRPATTASIGNPHTGTQGQFFLVLFSHGIPAAVAYYGWFLLTFIRTSRRARTAMWGLVILISLVESPFYDFMPITFYLIMIGAALAWRDHIRPAPEPMSRPAVPALAGRTVPLNGAAGG